MVGQVWGVKNGCYVLPGKGVYWSSANRPDSRVFSEAKPSNGYEIALKFEVWRQIQLFLMVGQVWGVKNGCYVLPGKGVYWSSANRPDPRVFSEAKPSNGYEIALKFEVWRPIQFFNGWTGLGC